MHKRIGILGYGEVGQSLHAVYQDNNDVKVMIRDVERDDGLSNLDVLNVCIPYSVNFVDIVKECIEQSSAKLTIIHSTVALGTTAEISQGTAKEATNVVHSPVRGVHPNLYESFNKFVKFVGAESYESAQMAVDHLSKIGMQVEFVGRSINSELGKLLSTTYYGMCIAWHGEMHKMCMKVGADFEQTVTRFNTTYNEGYTDLGKTNVVRPVLHPPKGKDAYIGGHCIISNTKLLAPTFDSTALKLVMEYKKQGSISE